MPGPLPHLSAAQGVLNTGLSSGAYIYIHTYPSLQYDIVTLQPGVIVFSKSQIKLVDITYFIYIYISNC